MWARPARGVWPKVGGDDAADIDDDEDDDEDDEDDEDDDDVDTSGVGPVAVSPGFFWSGMG